MQERPDILIEVKHSSPLLPLASSSSSPCSTSSNPSHNGNALADLLTFDQALTLLKVTHEAVLEDAVKDYIQNYLAGGKYLET